MNHFILISSSMTPEMSTLFYLKDKRLTLINNISRYHRSSDRISIIKIFVPSKYSCHEMQDYAKIQHNEEYVNISLVKDKVIGDIFFEDKIKVWNFKCKDFNASFSHGTNYYIKYYYYDWYSKSIACDKYNKSETYWHYNGKTFNSYEEMLMHKVTI